MCQERYCDGGFRRRWSGSPLVLVLLVLALLVCVPVALCAGASRVVTLTEKNFDDYVGKPDRYVFVLYCAKWSRDCQNLEQLWDLLSIEQSRKRHRDVFVAAKVDASKNAALLRRMDIRGYPTMMYYTPLEPQGLEYRGAREISLLESFIFQFT